MKHLFLLYADNRDRFTICNIKFLYKHINNISQYIYVTFPKSCVFIFIDFDCNDYFSFAEDISEQFSALRCKGT